jgi:hypothetical protein
LAQTRNLEETVSNDCVLSAVSQKIGKLKLLPLLSRCSEFTSLLHTFNVLPLVPMEDVISTHEICLFVW